MFRLRVTVDRLMLWVLAASLALVLTRTVIEVGDLATLTTRLQDSGVTFISPLPVAVPGAPWRAGLMVKDPDGHAVLLVQP